MWKILARHRRWVARCTITESINEETEQRRFSATIDGWQNWRLLVVQQTSPAVAKEVIEKVRSIQERIRNGEPEVFHMEQAW